MFSLTSEVIFKGKLASTSQKLLLTTEFPGSNFLLPTFSIGSTQDFQVANLQLATVNFEPAQLIWSTVYPDVRNYWDTLKTIKFLFGTKSF